MNLNNDIFGKLRNLNQRLSFLEKKMLEKFNENRNNIIRGTEILLDNKIDLQFNHEGGYMKAITDQSNQIKSILEKEGELNTIQISMLNNIFLEIDQKIKKIENSQNLEEKNVDHLSKKFKRLIGFIYLIIENVLNSEYINLLEDDTVEERNIIFLDRCPENRRIEENKRPRIFINENSRIQQAVNRIKPETIRLDVLII